jgi:hypothetical protein
VSKSFVKHIAEFRYLPMPLVLDKRGQVADKMLDGYLDKWITRSNRVDVLSEVDNAGAFISFTNSGFAAEGTGGFSVFLDALERGLEEIPTPKFTRIGFRELSLTATDLDFAKLLSKFETSLLRVPSSFKNAETSVSDIGITYILKLTTGNVRLQVGPMEISQASEIFDSESLPQVGLFLDIDFYRESPKVKTFKNLREFVQVAEKGISSIKEAMSEALRT